MDLPTENAGLNEADLKKVFCYAPQATAVVRFLTGDKVSLKLFPTQRVGSPEMYACSILIHEVGLGTNSLVTIDTGRMARMAIKRTLVGKPLV